MTAQTWRVIAGHGYTDETATAEKLEIVEGCLIFSDSQGATAIYSPDRWRIVIRQSDGRAVA